MKEQREVCDLCKHHIEECENLEKRRQNDAYAADRVELFTSNLPSNGGVGVGQSDNHDDPFLNSDLPDIDVEEDLKTIRNRNRDIVRTLLKCPFKLFLHSLIVC